MIARLRLARAPVLFYWLCFWVWSASPLRAQPSPDVPTPAPDPERSFDERSQPQQVLGEDDIPPVRDRQLGPRIAVTAIHFDQLPVYPERGITAEAVQAMAEKLRRHYTHEDELFASGFTRGELEELARQLQEMGAGDNPDAIGAEQVAQLTDTLRRQKRERGLSYADLDDIANQVTRFYREHGLILAKAYIPAQKVENGTVTLKVLEGELGKVVVQGNKKYSEERLREPFEQQIGKAVDSRRIEETLYLLNDYPGLNTYGFFSAGSEPGTTDLNLQVRQEKPLRFTLRGDNYGSRFTGDQRMFGMLDWFNPLGIGDQLSVGWLQSRSPVSSRLGVFNYSLPVFSPRTRLSLSYDHNDFSFDRSSEELRVLGVSGTNTNLTLALEHQLVRSRASNLSLGVALADKKTTLDSLVDLPGADEHVRSIELRANADHLSDRYRLLNMAALALQYGKFQDAVVEGRDDQYYKLALDTSSLKFMRLPYTDLDTRLLLRTKLRYSRSALPAFEQLSLGGADGVRAFTVSDFSADTAAQVTAEWYWPLPGGPKINNLFQFGLFNDTAYGVQNSTQGTDGDKWAYFSGFGVLLKFAWNDWFSAQLSVAHPSTSKSNLEGAGEDAKSAQSFLSFTWVLE